MMKTRVGLFLVLAVLAFVLAGCGGGESAPPVDWSEIPVVPGMDVYEGAEENMLDTFSVALQQAMGAQPRQVEIRYYWLPETIEWEQIEEFYQTALLERVWLPEEESAAFNTAVWTQNGGKQRLVVTALPLAESDGHILAVILSGG